MMDLLKAKNYINYLGKYKNNAFEVEPIILTKGSTKVFSFHKQNDFLLDSFVWNRLS